MTSSRDSPFRPHDKASNGIHFSALSGADSGGSVHFDHQESATCVTLNTGQNQACAVAWVMVGESIDANAPRTATSTPHKAHTPRLACSNGSYITGVTCKINGGTWTTDESACTADAFCAWNIAREPIVIKNLLDVHAWSDVVLSAGGGKGNV